jgi:hypothetical protein
MKMEYSKYLRGLSEFEGLPQRELISVWNPADITSIKEVLRIGVGTSRIEFAVEKTISDSALGNEIEKQFRLGVNMNLPGYDLRICGGKGYPDELLCRWADEARFLNEIKGKTSFCPSNGLRQVILSASRKLRRHFPEGSQMCHMFTTVFYSMHPLGEQLLISIIGCLPEFIQPWTIVEVRLESSASQRLLYEGSHEKLLVVPDWVKANPKFDTTVFESSLKTPATNNSVPCPKNCQPVASEIHGLL